VSGQINTLACVATAVWRMCLTFSSSVVVCQV
jgi:hypothetical protein